MFSRYVGFYLIVIFNTVAPSSSQYEAISCKIKQGYHITPCKESETVKETGLSLTCQQKSVTSLVSIISGNRRQINSLRKETHELKEKNRKLSQTVNQLEVELFDQKKAYQEMNDKLNLLSDKLNSVYEETLRISEEKTNKGRKGPPGELKVKRESFKAENCDVAVNGNCYLIITHDVLDVSFSDAVNICNNRKSVPASFPNQSTYNMLMEHLRSMLPAGWINMLVWTGLEIDTKTGNVLNASSFTFWKPGGLLTGSAYYDYTNVYLEILQRKSFADQGMGNFFPSNPMHGVICEIILQ